MKSLIVFFDVGGTLLDSPDFSETIAKKLIDKWQNNRLHESISETLHQIDQYKQEQPFRNIEDIYRAILVLLAKNYGYKDISNQARDLYLDVALYKTSLFPETISVLEKLLENRVKMIIASDEDTEIMERKLVNYNLNKYFIDKCISGSVRAYKPSNEFVSHLRKYTSKQEDNCYFVGDSPGDIECGKRLGISSILVDRKNLGNKAGADYIIHNLYELLPILNL